MCELGYHHCPPLQGVQVKLENIELFQKFHGCDTEMIITKSGRRMFPYLSLEVSGLDDRTSYIVLLEFNLSSTKRYKYNGTQWTQIGNAEPQLPTSSRVYKHPESPAVGRHWMSKRVVFNKVKLTNHTLDNSGNMVLTSMHKYLPTVHIVQTSDYCSVDWSPRATFTFRETEFIAVTAYQNQNVTLLKIDNNPFAKGFRKNGKSRLKRKFSQIKEEEEEEEEKEKDTYVQSPKLAKTSHCLSLSSTHIDDSGISSVSSATPPMSDGEDIFRLNNITYDHKSHQKIQIHHHHPSLTWMDLPLPPYPTIPPYLPTLPNLWSYSPYSQFYLPRPLPHIYPHHFSVPYLSQTSNPSTDSCLIDLSMPKET